MQTYERNSDLPAEIISQLTKRGQAVWRHAYNAALAKNLAPDEATAKAWERINLHGGCVACGAHRPLLRKPAQDS